MLPTHYTNVNRLLRDFNALIVEMGEFPAKDKINALTTMSENCQFARDIVHYMASTIRQVGIILIHPSHNIMTKDRV